MSKENLKQDGVSLKNEYKYRSQLLNRTIAIIDERYLFLCKKRGVQAYSDMPTENKIKEIIQIERQIADKNPIVQLRTME